MGRPSLLAIIYIVVGVVVALQRNYLDDIDGIRGIVSAVLAIGLWPLVLFGVNLRLGGGDGGKESVVLITSWWAWLRARFAQ